jgi:hypothetical protein
MLRHSFVSSHVFGLSVTWTRLYHCFHTVGITCHFCFSIYYVFMLLLTFVGYVASISGVVASLLTQDQAEQN